jgi:hypothetical protein
MSVVHECDPMGQLPTLNKYIALQCECLQYGTMDYMGEAAKNPPIPFLSQCLSSLKCCGYTISDKKNIFDLSFILSVASLSISVIITFVYVINCYNKRSEDRTIKTIMQRAQVHRSVATLNNLSNV